MDTREVAQAIGTTPRTLRQFLRSPQSTYVAVGSGSRYDFTDQDVTTIDKRFSEWKLAGKPKPEGERRARPKSKPRAEKQLVQDAETWEEEGPVVLADIRDPRVRARVRRDAQAAEDRLTLQLIARGVHISQGFATGLRKVAS